VDGHRLQSLCPSRSASSVPMRQQKRRQPLLSHGPGGVANFRADNLLGIHYSATSFPLCGSEKWLYAWDKRGDRCVRTQCKRGFLPSKHGSVATDGNSGSECRCDPASPDDGALTSSASAFQRCRGASRRIHWVARPWQHSTKRRMTQICPSRSRERHHPWEQRRPRRKHRRQARGWHASKRKAFLFLYDPREAPCVLCPRPLSEFCYSGKKNRTRIFWFRFERISKSVFLDICLYHSLVKILLQTIIASNETIRYHCFKSRF
jgi:hypothetical protein